MKDTYEVRMPIIRRDGDFVTIEDTVTGEDTEYQVYDSNVSGCHIDVPHLGLLGVKDDYVWYNDFI